METNGPEAGQPPELGWCPGRSGRRAWPDSRMSDQLTCTVRGLVPRWGVVERRNGGGRRDVSRRARAGRDGSRGVGAAGRVWGRGQGAHGEQGAGSGWTRSAGTTSSRRRSPRRSVTTSSIRPWGLQGRQGVVRGVHLGRRAGVREGRAAPYGREGVAGDPRLEEPRRPDQLRRPALPRHDRRRGHQDFQGPRGACVVYRAEPPEAALVGGRLKAYADEGTALLTVTVDGVDHTLKQDREHILQLLAEARAEVRAKAGSRA